MDRLTPEQRSRLMSRIRSKDTGPEIVVRKIAHRLGFRFRLHRRDLPGTPDLVFPRLRSVVLVHGCFWHSHGACRSGRMPASNGSYWGPKLRRNVERDAANEQALHAAGWSVLTVWECETTDRLELQDRLHAFFGPTRLSNSTPCV